MVNSRTEPAGPDGWPHRVLDAFLTALWDEVIDEDARVDDWPAWIHQWSEVGVEQPGQVSATAGTEAEEDATAAALRRILACGVDPDDLTDLVRSIQHELIYNVCDLLDEEGPIDAESDVQPAEREVRWQLMAVRGDPPVRELLAGLHESLDTYDPSGRGGEPRDRSRLRRRPLGPGQAS